MRFDGTGRPSIEGCFVGLGCKGTGSVVSKNKAGFGKSQGDLDKGNHAIMTV
jgi:hypothetical protein